MTQDNLENAVFQVLTRHLSRNDPPHPHSHKLFTWDFARAVIAEFLATGLFVLLLCSTAISANEVQIALTAGLSIATLVQCFGHISGGHINPAVTLAFMVTRKLPFRRGLIYIVSQCSGAIAGAGILYGVTADSPYNKDLGANVVKDGLSPWQGLGMEIILTFVLVFTIFATVDPHRKELGSSSLAIGLVILLAHLVGISFTGTGINPARSLGPAIVTGIWKHHWIFWVGPFLGAIAGGLLYEYVFDTTRRVQGLREALEDSRPNSNGQPKKTELVDVQSKI